jgi:hypothetical protein
VWWGQLTKPWLPLAAGAALADDALGLCGACAVVSAARADCALLSSSRHNWLGVSHNGRGEAGTELSPGQPVPHQGAASVKRHTLPRCAQVLQEVAEASDEEETAAGRPARPMPPPGADSPLPPDQEERRRRVLARLAAEEEGAIPPPQPRKPEGAEAEQVRAVWAACSQGAMCLVTTTHRAPAALGNTAQLWLVRWPTQDSDTAGSGPAAAKALNSLWGWSRGLASRVEAAAASVGRELAETVQDAQPAVREATRCVVGWVTGCEGVKGRFGG